MTKYFETSLHGMPVVVRDIEPQDIDAIVEYWHNGTEEYWRSIGVDVNKIVTPDKTRNTFFSSLPEQRGELDRITLIAESNSDVVAYTNVNLESITVGFAHVHVIKPILRSKGVAALLFGKTIQIFFEHYGLETIYFQTSTGNKRINAMLRKRGLAPIKELEVSNPDGMALPGHFYLYQIDKVKLQLLATQSHNKDTTPAKPE